MEVREDRDLFDAYLLTLQIEELTDRLIELKKHLKDCKTKLSRRLYEQIEKAYNNPVIVGKTLEGRLFMARLDDGKLILESFDLCPQYEEEV
ncbi:hypothetical protein [Kamptonema sp. UHCC 0994]|uniref:hypothetical protein n=1 Tax=Kamptonema sp. UHCC 0994 TaxID=3031329 RepID=UPI0023B892EA|nr:hypothetical protein [Kamptonema sp. UHCC 0994]MDF0553118.1 hypothetical protein [Kamptonema sp. UHCC 0994]